MPFLTGNSTSPGYACRILRIPGDLQFMMAVTGALRELVFSYNWEEFGEMTPEECAAAALEMFEDFVEAKCMIVGAIFPTLIHPDNLPDWLLPLTGGTYNRADYPELWQVIDNILPQLTTETQFTLPNLAENTRLPVPSGSGGNTLPHFSFNLSGSWFRTLTIDHLPSHTHVDAGHAHTEIQATTTIVDTGLEVPVPAATVSAGSTGVAQADIQPTGGGQNFDIRFPYFACPFVVVAR